MYRTSHVSPGYEIEDGDGYPPAEETQTAIDNLVAPGLTSGLKLTETDSYRSGSVIEPAFVYVPVVSNNSGFHRLDFQRTKQVNGRRWSERRLREIAAAQGMLETKVFEYFDYKAFAAEKALQQQGK